MNYHVNKKKFASGIILLIAGTLAASTMVFATGGGGGGGGGGGMPGGTTGNMGSVELSQSVITVKLQAPATGTLSRETEFIGTIEPTESVSVYPETSGKITAVYFEAGDTVQKGDLLFTLDDSDAQLSYQMAQASYEQKTISADTTLGSSYDSKLLSAKSQLESAQQSLSNARLKLRDNNDGYEDSLIGAEKAKDKAYETYKSAEQALDNFTGDKSSDEYADLYNDMIQANSEYSLAENAVKDLENDADDGTRDLRNSYKNAQTNYESALANYNLLTSGSLEDTQAQVDAELKSAQLSLEQSAGTLDKYKVYAPIGGVIETKSVRTYDMASSNTAAYVISNKDTMAVKFNATADAATALSIGDTVTLSKSGSSYTASIIQIDSKANASTGLFPIKARLAEDGSSLLSGVTVKVSATTQKTEDALLAPIDLVYYEDGKPYVFTYADGIAHRTAIETGMSNSETVEVVSGLTGNSQIITTWHPDLKDGAEVLLAEGQEE